MLPSPSRYTVLKKHGTRSDPSVVALTDRSVRVAKRIENNVSSSSEAYREPLHHHIFALVMVRFYWTYILECADGSYYVGMTNDMDRRLEEHQSGHDPLAYTHTRRPLKLVFSEMSNTPEQAIELEKKLKRWSRAKKEALIKGEFHLLPELSKKKFK